MLVAQSITFARIQKQIRRVAHRLHASGDDDLGIAGLDRLRAQRNRLQARTANLVDRHSSDLRRQSGKDRGLARRILSDARANHVAHDAFVDHVQVGDAGAADSASLTAIAPS